MKEKRLTRKGVWILLIGVLLVLIAGHGAFFYYISSHFVLSASLISSVIILVAVKLLLMKGRRLHSSVHRLFRHSPRSKFEKDRQ